MRNSKGPTPMRAFGLQNVEHLGNSALHLPTYPTSGVCPIQICDGELLHPLERKSSGLHPEASSPSRS